ncbi:MAG TPA: sugar ABC transporter permease [Acidimicrobiales bacterium]|nr:sugar ABC transporter permease [Acidimicrobiales bacterium]
MDRLRRNKFVIITLLLPALVAYTIVLPYPLARTIYYSFTNYNALGSPHYIGLSNYISLFTQDPEFRTALLNTLYLVVGSILLQLPLAFVLAFWLNTTSLRFTRFFRSVYFFPVAISGAAVGLVWQFLYQPKDGLVDGVVRLFGFHSFQLAWLASPTAAIWAVVISVSWQYFGYHMLIFTAGTSTVPRSVIDAAKVDGAGEWKVATRIVLPLLKPFITISLILITTASVTAFANVIALTDGGPGTSSTVLSLEMYQNSMFYSRYGYGSAIGVLLALINVLAVVLIALASYRSSWRRVRAAT